MPGDVDDFSQLGPNARHHARIEELFRELHNSVAGIRGEFMKDPRRDSFDRPFYTGFELPKDTHMFVVGPMRSRKYSKAEELTAEKEGVAINCFAAERVELAVVGKPDLKKGFYDGYGLDLSVGDIVAMLWSATDDEVYERTIIKYSEAEFAVVYKDESGFNPSRQST